MDKVIVTALLVIGAVTAAVVVIVTIGPQIGTSSQSAVEAQREASGRIKTAIEIIAVAPSSSGTQIEAFVKNVGVDPIIGIDSSDVFLIKSGTRFDAMTYSTDNTTKTWTGDRHHNTSLDWNRGDTLHIWIILLGGDVLGDGDHVLRFSTPNGITAEKIFSKAP